MAEDMNQMTDAELAETVQETQAEIARRARVREAERTTDDMALAYLQAAGRQQGTPFEDPVGFVGAYPRGWRVTHNDKSFEAAAPGVTTAPPGDGSCWVEVDSAIDVIPFWEPGEYAKGDTVRDAGQIWTALSDVDGPRPAEFPGGWSVVTP